MYRFDSAGRHLNTINTLTNATLHSFTYDGAGRLIQITDGDNNITTIERNGAGAPTGILSPFNQLTTLTLNGSGYLSQITDPAGHAYQFTYSSGGLMLTEVTPRGHTYTYTHDAMGRLVRDDDPASGFKTLARTEIGLDFTVALNTALGRMTSYQVQLPPTGDERRVNTLPDGLQTEIQERADSTITSQTPDGVMRNVTLGPDPRWRMQSPILKAGTITTPGGLAYMFTSGRTATLSNPADPLSLTTQTDTFAINGRNFTRIYTAAGRTFALTTPAGRQATATINTQGRVTQNQFANLNPAAYTYDARGRLATATFGTGMEARTSTLAYNPDGFLASITDPLNRVTGFTYDAAGRVTQQTGPDSRMIGFGYDANGNLTSLTPPGRPAHTFTYTSLNLISSYMPPAVPGTGQTTYAYNLDRQLTTITRPDSQTLSFTYDSAGRLSTLAIPGGQYLHH